MLEEIVKHDSPGLSKIRYIWKPAITAVKYLSVPYRSFSFDIINVIILNIGFSNLLLFHFSKQYLHQDKRN